MKTTDIYLGAIPWVGLQLVLVAVLIFFPQIVTGFLDHGPIIDPNAIQELDIPTGGSDARAPPPS